MTIVIVAVLVSKAAKGHQTQTIQSNGNKIIAP